MTEALGPLFGSSLPQHKYVSIADVQIRNEEELEKCPMSLVSAGAPAGRGHEELGLQCLTLPCALAVCQATQGPYFHNMLKLKEKREIIKENKKTLREWEV